MNQLSEGDDTVIVFLRRPRSNQIPVHNGMANRCPCLFMSLFEHSAHGKIAEEATDRALCGLGDIPKNPLPQSGITVPLLDHGTETIDIFTVKVRSLLLWCHEGLCQSFADTRKRQTEYPFGSLRGLDDFLVEPSYGVRLKIREATDISSSSDHCQQVCVQMT